MLLQNLLDLEFKIIDAFHQNFLFVLIQFRVFISQYLDSEYSCYLEKLIS